MIVITEKVQGLALEIAVASSWSLIESTSVTETEGDVQWMAVDPEEEYCLDDEFTLLTELKLAEVHPQHPTWIRRIAELEERL